MAIATTDPTADPAADRTDAVAVDPSAVDDELVEDEVLVEEISIDGMCGVY